MYPDKRKKGDGTSFAVHQSEDVAEKISKTLESIKKSPLGASDIRVDTCPVGEKIVITITWNVVG